MDTNTGLTDFCQKPFFTSVSRSRIWCFCMTVCWFCRVAQNFDLLEHLCVVIYLEVFCLRGTKYFIHDFALWGESSFADLEMTNIAKVTKPKFTKPASTALNKCDSYASWNVFLILTKGTDPSSLDWHNIFKKLYVHHYYCQLNIK